MEEGKAYIEQIIERVVQESGTTRDEIKRSIERAYETGRKSEAPQIRGKWEEITCEGENATAEEIIDYVFSESLKRLDDNQEVDETFFGWMQSGGESSIPNSV